MPNFINQKHLEAITAEQKAKLIEYFAAPGSTGTDEQIAALLGVEYQMANALLASKMCKDICDIEFLASHSCNPDKPVSSIPYQLDGFPFFPFICPHCGSPINNYQDLLFSSIAISTAK